MKEWVKDNVGRRGEDDILWGRWGEPQDENESDMTEDAGQNGRKMKVSGKSLKAAGAPRAKKPRKGEGEGEVEEIEPLKTEQTNTTAVREEERVTMDRTRIIRPSNKKREEMRQKRERKTKIRKKKEVENHTVDNADGRNMEGDWLKKVEGGSGEKRKEMGRREQGR